MRGAYNARRYWQERAERAGPAYVGPGSDPHFTERQGAEFVGLLNGLLETGRKVRGEPHGLALDFGCGAGRFTQVVAAQAHSYVGADISLAGIQLAQGTQEELGLPNVAFVHLSEDRIPLDTDSVDLLVAVTVFQHIVYDLDWRTWARELNRVMSPRAQAAVIDAGPSPNSAPHMRRRTPDEVASALGMHWTATANTPGHWLALLERRR